MSDESEVTVRLLRREEADLLIGLIRRCYGETYIDSSFYDEAVVEGRLRDGELSSVGAFDSGALVGHMGITRRPWGGNTADAGMTLVDPSYRGRGIARQVAVGLAEQSVAMGLVGVHDYPVTVHGATQRLAKGYGANTGLLLANMPADVSFENMATDSARARTSSLVRWLPFGRAGEREVYLPGRYRARIEALYEDVRLARVVHREDRQPETLESRLQVRFDGRRLLGRGSVEVVGADLVSAAAEATKAVVDDGALVVHLDLALADRATPWAVEKLRRVGFSFAALLPEFRDGDTLRLQWVDPSVPVESAEVLATAATRAIEAFVFEDRAGLERR
ncbi:MAG: GNAT family N-acetyltransferase [Myxococcota bacterium]